MIPNKTNIISDAWQMVRSQGLSFVTICVATFFFYNQFHILNDKIDACRDENIEILQETVNRNTDALNRNTEAFNMLEN